MIRHSFQTLAIKIHLTSHTLTLKDLFNPKPCTFTNLIFFKALYKTWDGILQNRYKIYLNKIRKPILFNLLYSKTHPRKMYTILMVSGSLFLGSQQENSLHPFSHVHFLPGTDKFVAFCPSLTCVSLNWRASPNKNLDVQILFAWRNMGI